MNFSFSRTKLRYGIIIFIYALGILIYGASLEVHDAAMLYSGAVMFFIAIIPFRFGLVSLPTVGSIFLLFILLIPFLAKYTSDTIYYSGVDVTAQEDFFLLRKTMKLTFIAAALHTLMLIIKGNIYSQRKQVPLTEFRVPIVFMGLLFLINCYITEPGPSLLSGNYEDVLQGRFDSGGTLAGVLLSVTWSGLFICYLKYKNKKGFKLKRVFFWFCTIAGCIWLFLHSRRTELVGILTVVFIDASIGKKFKEQIPLILFGAFCILSIFILGAVRGAALSDARLEQVVNAFDPKGKGYSVDVMMKAPAGSGNIFISMLTTVRIVELPSYGYQKGKTYLDYLYRLIPSDILKFLKIKPPQIYSMDLKGYATGFHGGCYFYAPIYGNFGKWGLFIVALLLGNCMGWIHNCFYSAYGLKLYISVMLALYFIKAFWYEPIFLPKALYFTVLTYIFLKSIFKPKPFIQPITVQGNER